ncbi:reverse transcriptase domain-containing protein [Artemisia annua]|uniref:Reverse transcriptase domain-containing protein n=1 Tax=Artemisia annua TaxID=35608 RepID=A0A2U1KS48_ARTAN|nr:reverse transcriptase domain-containing protein [Artemisia annua]
MVLVRVTVGTRWWCLIVVMTRFEGGWLIVVPLVEGGVIHSTFCFDTVVFKSGFIQNSWGSDRLGSLMVNTRHTDEFTSNPAFEAAVQRRVDALIPNITARIAERMQRNDPGSSGGSGGGNPPHTIATWLKEFSKEKPKSFSSASSPSEAEDWLGHIEKLFEVLGCEDEFKARLATYKFEGDALNWWKSYKAAKGDDFMTTLTWAGYKPDVVLIESHLDVFMIHVLTSLGSGSGDHPYFQSYQRAMLIHLTTVRSISHCQLIKVPAAASNCFPLLACRRNTLPDC